MHKPFTSLDTQVDAKEIAIDTDNDGVADILDLEPNTNNGNQVDANGKAINTTSKRSDLDSIQSQSDFDLIFFKDFYSTLYKVARYIQANPNDKIEITGYTDVLATEKYNLDLSEKRANSIYSMLVQTFEVDPNNLIINFDGENNPIIEGLPEQKDASLEAAYYINRRVEFNIKK